MRHGIRGRITIIKNGKKMVDKPIHSFVRNAHSFIGDLVGGCGTTGRTAGSLAWVKYDLKDVDGIIQTPQARFDPANFNRFAFAGNFFNKISVGTSTVAWTYDDFKLDQPYKDADAYSIKAQTTNATTKNSLQGLFHFTEDKIIGETGLFGIWAVWTDPYDLIHQINFLVSRDVLAPPIEVVAGDTIAVIYTIEVS
ncbi:MAG: hypothetical protein KIH08_15890 [Candidatus Freyarchaeota archaeon]|nr:hypothetical protein [Candidatus Jordarchaeia archaeon]